MIDAISSAVDGLADELIDAVQRAVRIPSINPRYPGIDFEDAVGGEAAVSRMVGEVYRAAGCDLDIFAEEPGRENCVGTLRGSGGGRSLLFNGHVDVVPPGRPESWSDGDPWSGRIADDQIWGRGSCDMKAGVLAQAFAALAIRRAGLELEGDLVLQAVVGEEMMEHELGTTACLRRGHRADAGVVAEASAPPTALAVVPVTPGLLWFEVAIEGRTTHTCLRGGTIHAGGPGSAAGVNAIDKAALILRGFRELEREWGIVKSHPLFPPGHFSICPGVIVGSPSTGLVPFAIPDLARIDYIVWHHPEEDADDVRAEIAAHVRRVAGLDPWLREHPPVVTWRHQWPQSSVPTSHPIVAATCAAHAAATGVPAIVAGFCAVHDGTYLNAGGVPTISYGPGDLRAAHAADEHVPIADVLTATRTFAILAAQWCGAHAKRGTT